jgi:hypothetical protein
MMETRPKCRIALRRLDMPLTPAVADAPLVASRHVGKRISLCAVQNIYEVVELIIQSLLPSVFRDVILG